MAPRPSRPFLLLGAMKPYAAVGPPDHTRQPTHGPRHRLVEAWDAPAVPAAATAARARSRVVTPDGTPGCRTAGTGSASRERSGPRTRDGRRRKNPDSSAGAGPRRATDTGSGPWGVGRLGSGRTPPLGAATAVPPALPPAFLLAIGGLPVLPSGPSSPPSPCRRPALGATVAGLGMGRPERLLTPFEQTPPRPRPTSPLTGSREAASWSGPKEAANFRRPGLGRGVPYLRPERLVSPHRPPWPIPSLYPTAERPAIQQAHTPLAETPPVSVGRATDRNSDAPLRPLLTW